jgi:hypothetical protein
MLSSALDLTRLSGSLKKKLKVKVQALVKGALSFFFFFRMFLATIPSPFLGVIKGTLS